jgi:hypothetical protein
MYQNWVFDLHKFVIMKIKNCPDNCPWSVPVCDNQPVLVKTSAGRFFPARF